MTVATKLIGKALAIALLAIPAASQAASAESPATAPLAVGLTDHPCPPGSSGRPPETEAFARKFVADGPMDPAAMQAYARGASARAAADQAQAQNDWADLCLYEAADATVAAEGGARVVFLGDSITELWRVADPTLFTKGVVDRGVSGQTSGQALMRFYPDVVDLHPKVVHIMIGTNDIAGNNGPSRLLDIENNISAMVDIAKAHRIQVVLASVLPAAAFPWRPQIKPAGDIVALNSWLKRFAESQGVVFVDYYPALAGADGGMRPGFSRDGVHPLVKAYRLMRPLADAAVAKGLARGPSGP